jgi:hypothetical protein
MMETGAQEDESFRRFRDNVNALIRLAPSLSVFLFVRLWLSLEDSPNREVIPSDNPIIEQAQRRVASRVAKFILLESVSGWAITIAMKAARLASQFSEAVTRRIQWLLEKHSIEDLANHVSALAHS